jgi:hypothetical protein
MDRRLAGILVAGLACVAIVVSAQQGQPRPGPGSGIVTVDGAVKVANAPPTTKDGEWGVAIANTPSVNVANTPSVNLAPPPFVTVGKRYQIVWPSGETEQITVGATAGGTWVRVAGPEAWINLAQARKVTLQ